jgi:hypothetical protein
MGTAFLDEGKNLIKAKVDGKNALSPKGKTNNIAGKFQEVDNNFIHIIIDKTDSQSYYHAMSVLYKISRDFRFASFNFQPKIYSKEDVFIPEYCKCNKEQLKSFFGQDVTRLDFVEKIGTGDIVLATGGDKVLNGFSELATKHDEAFFYFGATKKLEFFKKEKANFDLITLEHNSITQEEMDDDNIIGISENAVFFDEDFIQELDKKAEKDYIFAVLPYLTNQKKQEIKNFKKQHISSIHIENFLKAIRNSYEENHKIVIVSNLLKDVDLDVEFEIRNLIEITLKRKNVKIKFLHHDYAKDNKIPEIVSHLTHNSNDKIILPTSHFSEINLFGVAGVANNKIFWFKNLDGIHEAFTQEYGFLTDEILQKMRSLTEFSQDEIEALKYYKSQEIQDTVISNYIANCIVELYIEDTQNRDAKTEISKEEEFDEEDEDLEEEESLSQNDDEPEEEPEEEVEVEEGAEVLENDEEVEVEKETEVEVSEDAIEENIDLEEDFGDVRIMVDGESQIGDDFLENEIIENSTVEIEEIAIEVDDAKLSTSALKEEEVAISPKTEERGNEKENGMER